MGLNRYPITFSAKNEVQAKDFRFVECEIDVLHTGVNRKLTDFSKEVVDKAVPSIKNTPILGYIEQSGQCADFKGHEHELKIDEDGVVYAYAGQAYGVIPESCNPRWVTHDDGTGVQRKYLRVDGLLWTKFEDSTEIVCRDKRKNHSMEITDIQGYVDERGIYVVKSFLFDGCCMLSLEPAMTGSALEVKNEQFSVQSTAHKIQDMLNMYMAAKQEYACPENKKDKEMEGENVMSEKAKVPELGEAQAQALGFAAEGETAQSEQPEVVVQPEAAQPQAQAQPEGEFALNTVQMLDEVRSELSKKKYISKWGEEECLYHLQEVQGSTAIVVCDEDCKFYGIPFEMNGDNVTLDYALKKRMKTVYEPWDEGSAEQQAVLFEAVNAKLAQMYEQLDEMKAAKQELEKIKPAYEQYVAAEQAAALALAQQKREQLFAKMDERLHGDEEYEALKLDKTLAFEQLETQCYTLFGKKSLEFSYLPAAPKDTGAKLARFGVSGAQTGKTKGEFDELFEHYGVR